MRTANEPGKESAHWYETYADPAARARRRAEMPHKLRKLGADRIPKDADVLDLCCGNGEALEALYELGFRSLHGADIALPETVAADSRYEIYVGDALRAPYDPQSFDWIIIVHAMHHFESAEKAIALIDRCRELLRPGGRLSILDFPGSPQIWAAFWFFRQKPLLFTPYLKNFGALIDEEWPFLQHYLPQFHKIWKHLHNGALSVEIERNELFYFYLTLRKATAGAEHNGSAKPVSDWSAIHTEEKSWRAQLLGEINAAFVVPRYVKLFYDTFGTKRGQSYFEVGSGNGDLSRAILAKNDGHIARYVVSDYFPDAVTWLQRQGLEAVQADAQALPFGDEEFDAVIDFDVMHHVDRPRDMARELMRVGRGKTLLVESNGLSVPRRLLEFTPGHRAAGERSYTPWQYRSFFERQPGFKIKRFSIYPFLFPFKTPRWALRPLVWFNGRIERIPFFRWQCSSVVITIEYERTPS